MMEITDYTKFVEIWMKAIDENQTQSWIAEQFNVSPKKVSQLAAYLRSRNVELPKMAAHNGQLTPEKIEELNNLIKEEK